MRCCALIFFLLSVECVLAQDAANQLIQPKVRPEFSFMSYLAGLVVLIAFVIVPVGMMAYRNRNSIVEFIKHR